MSKQSAGQAQVISLPKGGGALHGIGEKFSPDLHTGTGNFTVPIALPPGRNGFQPQLSLGYSTGNGSGPFGLGWSMSVPGVSRKTSKGIPVYDDSKDVFILSGAEDLVAVPGAPTDATRYRPRTEGLFALIDHHHDAGNNYWEVRSKDGLISLYGTPAARGTDPAVITKTSDRQKVFAWKLTKTTDPFGNKIQYDYERDAGEVGPHQWDQLYLKRIHYGDYTDAAGSEQFLVSVTFDYGDPATERPDPFSEYRAGFEIRTRRLCRQIIVRTHADKDRLVRTYRLVYENDLHNGVSLLRQVQVVGHDDAGTLAEELPPLEFGYTRFDPEKRKFFPIEGSDLPARSLADPDFDMVELFGNGLPDILEMNGAMRYWRNLGGGRYDLPREMKNAPAGVGLAQKGVQLIDANGDGRTDLLVTTELLDGYYPLQFGGLWNAKSFERYRAAPSFDLKDPEVRLVDLDGDGITDAIRSGTRLECFFNDQHQGWTPENTRWVERRTIEDFPNINFSDPRVKWADLSGDGLQDIALIYDGNVEYWPNLGRADWGKRVHMENSPRFPPGYDPRRILIGDVDGDGLADIVYVDDTKVTLWINQSGNRWLDPIVIEGTPPVSDMDAVRLADVLGNGISGVLWSADAGGLSRRSMFFLDFTGGAKPYLLQEMNNHTGALTRVGYSPSTRFYLEDQKQIATRWKSPLPFPVQVVARVEVIDELSQGKLTTEYHYHHGYWDGAEREFRGFGRVDHLDTETFSSFNQPGLHGDDRHFLKVEKTQHFSPPTLTKIWFHQGPVGDEFGEWKETDFRDEFSPDDPPLLSRPKQVTTFLDSLPRRVKRDALRTLRGSILRSELYALDGTNRADRPYTVTENLPGVCEVMVKDAGSTELRFDPLPGDSRNSAGAGLPSPAAPRIFFPHSLAQRTTQWERGDDPMIQFTFTGDYDNFGQPRAQTQIACPRGWRSLADKPGQPYLATRTGTVYAKPIDPSVFIMERVAKTTSYEIRNKGNLTAFALKDLPDSDASLQVIGQTLNFYDGPAFIGLPLGQVGQFGAVVRTETLVLTEAILQDAFRSGDTVLPTPEQPPYLMPRGPPVFTAEYPAEFQKLLPTLAGYIFHAGGPGATDLRGYFVNTSRRKYDFHNAAGQRRGLVVTERDPLDHDTAITFDFPFHIFPAEVIDPVGLKTSAIYDHRVSQPREVTDPNGNKALFTFSPLGLLQTSSVQGKAGEGDQTRPSVKLEYGFLAFFKSPPHQRQPIFVRSIRQVHHDTETDVPLPQRDESITSVEFSDGFGRLLQTRAQAEDVVFGDVHFGNEVLPADQAHRGSAAIGRIRSAGEPSRVVVSGWQMYDNKGRVVEKFEPFFSSGFDYAPPTDAQFGQKATLFYDPRGLVTRTVNPDGSENRVIHGVPGRIAVPDLNRIEIFEPTPWEAYTYDVNDNAGRTHPDKARDYENHWNTPASAVVDAAGRTVLIVERNRAKISPGDPTAPTEEHRTSFTYDVRGNVLTVTDALGRVAFRYIYDVANRPLRIESIDAGLRRTVLDAVGNVVEHRDSKGALILRAYDLLSRPIRLWASDGSGEQLTLRDRLEYGDGSALDQPAAERNTNRELNLLGKITKLHDEAGLLAFEALDFKGNVLEKSRQVISDAAILKVFLPPPGRTTDGRIKAFRVDWQPPAGAPLEDHALTLLDARLYQTSVKYDGLNRIKSMAYPEDVEGKRKELRPQYNRAGALEKVELDGTIFVERIAYNAKGQRTFIAYGNRVMTRYAYDPHIFRLVRLRGERFTKPETTAYQPTGAALQDFAYEYDLAGNILKIHDRTPASGILDTELGRDALDRTFTYDPLYRLLSATGRECDLPLPDPWDDSPRCQDLTRTRPYRESYEYDRAGNMANLKHTNIREDGSTRGNHRKFELVPGTNRLKEVTFGASPVAYTYDDNGNLTSETITRHFEWDYADSMKVHRTQVGTSEPSIHSHFLYDAGKLRVKKLVRKQGGKIEVTVYIDGIFEHQHVVHRGSTQENNTLHVMDDAARVAVLRVGKPFADDATPAVKYDLGDHLRSSNLVIDGTGALVGREEFTPYGETSFGSFAKKRYRFSGKERDEETGLEYFGARYYAPWCCKWITPDPLTIFTLIGDLNLYGYVAARPLVATDPLGLRDDLPDEPFLAEGPNGVLGTWQYTEEPNVNATGNERKWIPGVKYLGDLPGVPDSTKTFVPSPPDPAPGSSVAPTFSAGLDSFFIKHGEKISVGLLVFSATVATAGLALEALGLGTLTVGGGAGLISTETAVAAGGAGATAAPKAADLVPEAKVLAVEIESAVGGASGFAERGKELFDQLGAKLVKPGGFNEGTLAFMKIRLNIAITAPSGTNIKIITVQNRAAYKLLMEGAVKLRSDEVLGFPPTMMKLGEELLPHNPGMIHSEILGVWNAMALGAEGGKVWTSGPACGFCNPLFGALTNWVHKNAGP